MPANLIEGKFLERINRFTSLVSVGGKTVKAYLPNTGRLKELLTPGASTYLYKIDRRENRKTLYNVLLVKSGKTLVSVDTRIPNLLLEDCFKHCSLPGFEKYKLLRREVPYKDSRFDFLLENDGKQCYVEVKSVTLNKKGGAFFPDAPTLRGRKHLHELVSLKKAGYGAFIIFLAQRYDSTYFSPNDETDPLFGKALREALASGVEARAFRCRVTLTDIGILDQIPVRL